MRKITCYTAALSLVVFSFILQGCDNGQNGTNEGDDTSRIVLPGEKDTTGSTGPDTPTTIQDTSVNTNASDTGISTKKDD